MARFVDYDDWPRYWPTYVPAATRRTRAAGQIATLRKSGRGVSPVEIKGRKIARTFWGQSWCKNLEAYSDYANRLPRGRTYVRNGSVVDLEIASRRVTSLVSGRDLYQVEVAIQPLAARKWRAIRFECAGKIESIVELLSGSLSESVMEIVTRKGEGLFPTPKEISLSCSCPDWASMCKNVAATLYGVGARLDDSPELLFTLRDVDAAEMVIAATERARSRPPSSRARILASAELSSVFGIDIDDGKPSPRTKPRKKKSKKVSPPRKARRTARS